ncbi:MAG: ketoacyl-ACP synthase III [Ruminiclostridium sp.]|nr:ketoacyl-ACP synthase III [Ruminiclostridium sp.]
MKTTITGVEITGIASAVPEKWCSLEEQFGSLSDEEIKTAKKFRKSTGVNGRYLCGNRQTASDLCFAAADKLLAEKNIDRNKIGVLVFVTQTEDYRSPASAFVIQHRLGIGKSCIVFDVNLGCSGFTCGLNIVSSILLQSDAEYGLLLCGDTSARERNPDRSVFVSNSDKMLFGDSGTATLLRKNSSAKEMLMLSASDGDGFKKIVTPYEWYRNPKRSDGETLMDGISVFNFSTEEAPAMINDLMREAGTAPEDYDCLVLHQANIMIIDRIAKLTGFTKEQNIRSIDTFGNTSSGSIPNTLVHNFGGESERSVIRCMMCGYGVGLSWSAVDCYLDKKDILPLIHTDEYFDDGMHID